MLKKTIIAIILFIPIATQSLFGQYSLKIEISDLRNNSGQIILELNNENGERISGFYQGIDNNKSIIIINNLKPGKYSFKYFHDENKNEKLDTNILGIPKEGFGFSNNAKGTFGPPAFNKTVFDLKSDRTVRCNIQYY